MNHTYSGSFSRFQSVTKSVQWPYTPIVVNSTKAQTSKSTYYNSLLPGFPNSILSHIQCKDLPSVASLGASTPFPPVVSLPQGSYALVWLSTPSSFIPSPFLTFPYPNPTPHWICFLTAPTTFCLLPTPCLGSHYRISA